MANDPGHADSIHLLGVALYQSGQHHQALRLIANSLYVDEGQFFFYANLGNILRDLARLDDALAAGQRALVLSPDQAEPYNNLTNILREKSDIGRAVVYGERALTCRPDYAEACYNLGLALQDQGRIEEAAALYRRSLVVRPAYPQPHAELVFLQLYHGEPKVEAILPMAHRFFTAQIPCFPVDAARYRARPASARPRIGLVSGDFRVHAVGFLAIPAIEALARLGYSITCYATSAIADNLTERYRRAASRWVSIVAMSDAEAAQLIEADAIDILFDLSGFTGHNRLALFARKPAPIQISWLGCPSTTALPAIDYLLADIYQLPPSAEPFFTEKICRLPHSYAVFEPLEASGPVSELPAAKNGFVTFGSFNALKKITPQVVRLWCRLLQRLPQARLLIKAPALSCAMTRSRFETLFVEQGIDPARLLLVGASTPPLHLATMAEADIGLDSFPYSGGRTTLEVLWMGLPVVTLPGDTMASRHSLGYLMTLGLTDLVAADTDSYLEIACSLATDLARLGELRRGLRQRMLASPLCDVEGFARDMGAALDGIWQSWRNGRQPGQKTVEELFATAVACHHNGQAGSAGAYYRRILISVPDHPESLHHIGVLAQQSGLAEEALRWFARALSCDAGLAEAWSNRGTVLQAGGRLVEAVECFRRALRQRPTAAFWYNLGNADVLLERRAEAIHAFRAAVVLQPDHSEALNNLGGCLKAAGEKDRKAFIFALRVAPTYLNPLNNYAVSRQEAGHPEVAENCYRRAIVIDPAQGEADNNLGTILHTESGPAAALGLYRRSLLLRPDYVEAANNLANACRDLGRPTAAAATFRRSIAIFPGFAKAINNLGNVYKDLGRGREAVTTYLRASRLQPDYSDVYNNLGVLFCETAHLASGSRCFRLAASLAPAYFDAWLNHAGATYDAGHFSSAVTMIDRCLSLRPGGADLLFFRALYRLPTVAADARAADAALSAFDSDLAIWSSAIDGPQAMAKAAETLGNRLPFYLAYRRGNHRQRLASFGILAARVMASVWPANAGLAGNARIHLAVVSRHVRRHSVWDIILRGLLLHIDRQRFQVTLVHTGYEKDEETERARTMVDGFYDGLSNLPQALDLFKNLGPDVILYPELGMDPLTFKLAALRLAPLQAASWGHPITTGLPTIDLFLSGEKLEPPDAASHYSEKLILLPGTGACTMPALPGSPVELTAPNPKVRFILCQTPFKFDPEDDGIYLDIAKAVENCQFWFVRFPRYENWTQQLLERLERCFSEAGLDFARYFHILDWLPTEQFQALLGVVDVYLDCPAFSGYTTGLQAVRAGLPIVTLEGAHLRERLAAGLLRHLDLGDTIAGNRHEYVAIARRLARESQDPARWANRRRRIMEAARRADDDRSVVRAFEAALIEGLAERRRQMGLPPIP
ncbi:MAG TPA: tetratricopeptide repeat protein [Rhodospirillaceae bacterium]|nr:tetratricopeptide repeat protein [Rhodospirillaceae bacterium]